MSGGRRSYERSVTSCLQFCVELAKLRLQRARFAPRDLNVRSTVESGPCGDRHPVRLRAKSRHCASSLEVCSARKPTGNHIAREALSSRNTRMLQRATLSSPSLGETLARSIEITFPESSGLHRVRNFAEELSLALGDLGSLPWNRPIPQQPQSWFRTSPSGSSDGVGYLSNGCWLSI
jgi:hypothetical protein